MLSKKIIIIIIIIATNYSTGAKMDLKQQYILVLAPLTN